MRGVALLAAALLGCSPLEETDPVIQEKEPGTTRRTIEELPPMPQYPLAQTGKLVVVSDGDFSVQKSWPAQAGFCAGGMLVELYAEGDSSGTVVVLQHPESDVAGQYPVLLADSVAEHERAARIGVQVFAGTEAFGFQAFMGSLEVTGFGEKATGRFTSTLSEIGSGVLTRYVGVFHEVPVKPFSDEYCAGLQPEDPEVTTDTTTDRDSIAGAG